MENILQIKNLSIVYTESQIAVHDLSMDIPKGSIVAIVGESGSGKSTALRSFVRLLSGEGRIASGEILFHDEDLTKMSQKRLRQIRGRRISMIFQDAAASLDPRKKIGYQYVEVLRSHFHISKEEASRQALEMLEKIHLPDPQRVMDSYPFELSGGMIQRVAIAMAVSMRSELLLADEPTSALDVTIQAQVVNLMMELRRDYGTTIVIVTHNLGVAAYMADYIAVMHHGRLVELNTRDNIVHAPKDDYTKMLIAAVPDMEVASFA